MSSKRNGLSQTSNRKEMAEVLHSELGVLLSKQRHSDAQNLSRRPIVEEFERLSQGLQSYRAQLSAPQRDEFDGK